VTCWSLGISIRLLQGYHASIFSGPLKFNVYETGQSGVLAAFLVGGEMDPRSRRCLIARVMV
jgi:hypothetical protein